MSSLDNLLSDAYIIYQNGVDSFEIEHKHVNFGVRGVVPLKTTLM